MQTIFFPLLVQDGVQSDGGLSRLAVTDDQLTLATANGEHGVDGQNARLQWLIHRLAVNDTRGRGLHRIVVLRRDLTGIVYGLAQRVDHAAQKALAHRRARHLSGAAHHTALHDLAVVSEDHAADLGFPQIQDHTLQSTVKQQYLAVFRSGKPTDCGDPVAHCQHGAYLVGMGHRFKAPDGLPHQRHHIAMAVDSLRYDVNLFHRDAVERWNREGRPEGETFIPTVMGAYSVPYPAQLFTTLSHSKVFCSYAHVAGKQDLCYT